MSRDLFNNIYESYKNVYNCPRSCIKPLPEYLCNMIPVEYTIDDTIYYIQLVNNIGIDIKIVLLDCDDVQVESILNPAILSVEQNAYMFMCPAGVINTASVELFYYIYKNIFNIMTTKTLFGKSIKTLFKYAPIIMALNLAKELEPGFVDIASKYSKYDFVKAYNLPKYLLEEILKEDSIDNLLVNANLLNIKGVEFVE